MFHQLQQKVFELKHVFQELKQRLLIRAVLSYVFYVACKIWII